MDKDQIYLSKGQTNCSLLASMTKNLFESEPTIEVKFVKYSSDGEAAYDSFSVPRNNTLLSTSHFSLYSATRFDNLEEKLQELLSNHNKPEEVRVIKPDQNQDIYVLFFRSKVRPKK